MSAHPDSATFGNDPVYRQLFVSLGVPVILFRLAGDVPSDLPHSNGASPIHILEVNDSALRLLEAEALPGDPGTVFPREARTAVSAAVADLRRGIPSVERKLRLRTPRGKAVPVRAVFSPAGPGDGTGDIAVCLTPRADREASVGVQREWAGILREFASPVLIADREGKITLWSRGAEELFGYSAPEMLGAASVTLLQDSAREDLTRAIQRDMDACGRFSGEIPCTGKDGRTVSVMAEFFALEGDSGARIETYRDISAQIHTVRTLYENLRRVRCVFEGSNYGMWDWDIAGGETFFVRHWAEILGYSPEEMADNTNLWEKSIHPDDEPRATRALQDHLDGVTPFYETIHRMRARSGEWRWLLDRGRVVERDSDGKPLRAAGINVDLTEYKRTEEALRQSEERLHLIIESTNDMVVLLDTEGRYQYYSGPDYYGIAAKDLTGKTPYDIFPRENAEEIVQWNLKVILTGQSQMYESSFLWGGEIHHHSNHLFPVRELSGPVTGVLTFCHNITENKRMEAALQESETRFRSIFEAVEDSIFVKDRELRYIQVNPAMARLLDIPADRLAGTTDRELYGAESWEHSRSVDLRVLSGEIVEEEVTNPVDGAPRVFHTIKTPIFDHSGAVAGICGVARDITDRKQSEFEQLDRSHFLQILIDTIPNPMYYQDIGGKYLGCNRAFEEFIGFPREEIIGKTSREISPAELADTYETMDRTLLESPGVQTCETLLRNAEGTLHSVIVNKATYQNINGGLGGIVGIIIDITTRKEIERALIESEKRYRGLIESQSDLVIRIDPDGRFTYANDAYCLKFGKSRKQLIGKPFIHLVHEDDLPSTIQAMRNLEKPPYRVSIEQRALTVEGWRWIAWEDYAIKNESGVTIEIQKVGRDITNYKVMQEDLIHEIEFIRLISSVSSSFINLAADDIGNAIATSLERIGVFTGFDRVDVIPVSQSRMVSGFTWRAAGTDFPAVPGFEILLAKVPSWMEQSGRYGSFLFSGPDTLPRHMRKEGDLFRTLSVQSMAAVPLVYNKSLHGFLSLISVREERRWREEDVALLSTVADIFVNALAHRQTEMELEQSKKELQRAERLAATGRLAASIAHEINNPLQAMTANISFLGKALPADFPQRQVLEQLKMGILRIKNTVRQLLDIHRSKSEASVTVQVNEVIESTLNLVENQLIINRITVERKLAGELPPIRGLAQELFQVFMNIILNAMDAMPLGGTLTLRSELAEAGVQIIFSDTGNGISEKDMEHIFDPFFTTKSKMLGTGLGLSIVKGIVESFGGTISVTSIPEKGATFTLTFPVSS